MKISIILSLLIIVGFSAYYLSFNKTIIQENDIKVISENISTTSIYTGTNEENLISEVVPVTEVASTLLNQNEKSKDCGEIDITRFTDLSMDNNLLEQKEKIILECASTALVLCEPMKYRQFSYKNGEVNLEHQYIILGSIDNVCQIVSDNIFNKVESKITCNVPLQVLSMMKDLNETGDFFRYPINKLGLIFSGLPVSDSEGNQYLSSCTKLI